MAQSGWCVYFTDFLETSGQLKRGIYYCSNKTKGHRTPVFLSSATGTLVQLMLPSFCHTNIAAIICENQRLCKQFLRKRFCIQTIERINNNNPQAEFGEGSVYADFTLTFKPKRLFPIDPSLKKK